MLEAEKWVCVEDSARKNVFRDPAEFGPAVLPSCWSWAHTARINDVVFLLRNTSEPYHPLMRFTRRRRSAVRLRIGTSNGLHASESLLIINTNDPACNAPPSTKYVPPMTGGRSNPIFHPMSRFTLPGIITT